MINAIEVKSLTRAFGPLVVVDHISFEVRDGEIFGILGANGAGKTTTIMMLATAFPLWLDFAILLVLSIILAGLGAYFFSKMEAD